jgi:methylglutaconyl-CoA hydratase
MGISAMSQIAIDANTFFSPEWAKQKGLYADVFDSVEELDEAIDALAKQLCTYNPEAVKHMKTMFWRGTEDWDELLMQRAEISGKLVLSSFTKEKLESYK